MFGAFKKIITEKEHGFTLIEIIIVIIIVGILAALGISQYSKTVEKGRGAEARMILGYIRKLAYEYYIVNGTTVTFVNDDANIGSASDQIPGNPCRSTHYFYYYLTHPASPNIIITAVRCTTGGKSPQGSGGTLTLTSNLSSGVDTWGGDGGY